MDDASVTSGAAAAISVVVARWRDEGLAGDPATAAQLDEAEVTIGARLPAAMRALYLEANGTESYPEDWLMLLPIDVVAGSVHRDGATISITFGDFMESLYAVVLRLGPDAQAVWREGGDGGPIELAPDFDTFLHRAAAGTRAMFA